MNKIKINNWFFIFLPIFSVWNKNKNNNDEVAHIYVVYYVEMIIIFFIHLSFNIQKVLSRFM